MIVRKYLAYDTSLITSQPIMTILYFLFHSRASVVLLGKFASLRFIVISDFPLLQVLIHMPVEMQPNGEIFPNLDAQFTNCIAGVT